MKNTIQDIFEVLRDYLISHENNQSKILSVYANIDTKNPDNRRERPAWLIDLKNHLDGLSEAYGDGALRTIDPTLMWREVKERIIVTLSEREPSGRSLALFTDLVDDIVIDLPLPVKTSAYYGLPQVKHLLSQLHRYGKYLVVLFSETEHRVISIDTPLSMGEAFVESGIKAGVFLRPGGRKSRTQASERRDLGSERGVIRDAAHEINSYFMDNPTFDRIVFGGNLKIAHGVKNALHHTVSELLVSIEPIPFKASEELVRNTVKLIADEYETIHDNALVNELVTRRETCGRGVTGAENILDALNNGQVRKLFIPYPIVSDEFDSLIVEALLANVEIELVHGEAAERLKDMGGAGALLYYVIE